MQTTEHFSNEINILYAFVNTCTLSVIRNSLLLDSRVTFSKL